MSKRYYVGGLELVPVADATFETLAQSIEHETGTFVIAFYDFEGTPATPLSGSIKPEMSPINGQWLEPSSGDATIDATLVVPGLSTYVMPVFLGPADLGRITLGGITGVTHFSAYFWRT